MRSPRAKGQETRVNQEREPTGRERVQSTNPTCGVSGNPPSRGFSGESRSGCFPLCTPAHRAWTEPGLCAGGRACVTYLRQAAGHPGPPLRGREAGRRPRPGAGPPPRPGLLRAGGPCRRRTGARVHSGGSPVRPPGPPQPGPRSLHSRRQSGRRPPSVGTGHPRLLRARTSRGTRASTQSCRGARGGGGSRRPPGCPSP